VTDDLVLGVILGVIVTIMGIIAINSPAGKKALDDGCGVDRIRVCQCVPPGMSYGSN